MFGSKLREQRFTTSDFALNVLNRPLPFGNCSTRFGGTWNLFDSLASWRSVDRAEREKEAANHELERADPDAGSGRAPSPYWYLLTAFVGLNLFQSAFTDWCPMISILRKAGVKS